MACIGIGPLTHTGLVLASASSGRLDVLRRAGVEPIVRVSAVDESALTASLPPEERLPSRLPLNLAVAKCREVAIRLAQDEPALRGAVVVGCDSMLEFDGEILGKPEDRDDAVRRLRQMSGSSGVLHTGHAMMRVGDPSAEEKHPCSALASTRVDFEPFTEYELQRYVDTGEPLNVAGSFTLDGLGGAFITGIAGDPSNVVGISLPLVRRMLAAHFDVAWTSLWAPSEDR